MTPSLVTVARPEWALETRGLLPGAHVALLADSAGAAVEGRLLGLELRDAILVLRPGPTAGFVFLFRVPIAEGTIVGQVLATGTGALNIDGCRIPSGGEHFRSTVNGRGGGMLAADPREGASLGMFQADAVFEPTNHLGGRWPPNMLLVHGPGCRKSGTKKVKSGVAHEENTVTDPGFNGGWGRRDAQFGYAGGDGLEEVPAWECELGCPTAILDNQSGILTSGALDQSRRSAPNHEIYGAFEKYSDPKLYESNSGGASRFFPQFKDEDELHAWLTRLVSP